MNEPAPSRRPGRRKDGGKRAAILEAARRLMFEAGVEAVSMESVAAEAGVSKVTVYAHFGDKLSLFEAVVRQQSEWLTSPFPESTPPAERLVLFGHRLLTFIMSPERLAADRVLRQEAQRHPELARRFFAAGPGRLRDELAAHLKREAEQTHLNVRIADPVQAAEDLMSLWRGLLDLEVHFQSAPPPAAETLRRRAERAVGLFLRAYAAPECCSADGRTKKPFGRAGDGG